MEDKNRRAVLSISLPEWLAAFIKERAEEDGLSVSDYVKNIILKGFYKQL